MKETEDILNARIESLESQLRKAKRERDAALKGWNDCDREAERKIRERDDRRETLLRSRIAYLESVSRERDEALAEMRKCCSQRGARMQLMKEWMESNSDIINEVWPEFLEEYPEAEDWFDSDGVPKAADREDYLHSTINNLLTIQNEDREEIRRLREALSKVLFQFDGAINYMEDEMEDDVVEDLRSLQKEAQHTLDGVPK